VDGFCDLLSGDVNWAGVMKELKAAGYQGWVAAEMIPPVPFYKHCPEVLVQNTSRADGRYLRALNSLRRKRSRPPRPMWPPHHLTHF